MKNIIFIFVRKQEINRINELCCFRHSQSEIETKVASFRALLLHQLNSVNNNTENNEDSDDQDNTHEEEEKVPIVKDKNG